MENASKKSGWVTLFLVVSIIALLCDLVWLASLAIGESATYSVYLISLFFAVVIIPVFLLDIAGFISSFSSKDSRRGLLRCLSGAGIGLFVVALILLGFDNVNAEKLEKNYLTHSAEISQAIDYTLASLDDGSGIEIEFGDLGRINRFHIYKSKDKMWSCTWDPTRKQVDSLAAELGLGRKEIEGIRSRLYDAKCHSIMIVKQDGTYDVATVIFRRDMASDYSYDIHKNPMTEEEMEYINENDCERIAFDEFVCFVYGSPAFGSSSFPGKKEYLSKHQSD